MFYIDLILAFLLDYRKRPTRYQTMRPDQMTANILAAAIVLRTVGNCGIVKKVDKVRKLA
ncbi:hypothetical protein NZ30_06525 [Xanthomonas translucens pv. undulosa]|nr:hypothetical protein NZ30_06525 [Xanthomonas translucens pv. undulosa]